MSVAQRSMPSDTLRIILMAVMLLGLLAVGVAIVSYVQAQNELASVANASRALTEQMATLDSEQQAAAAGGAPIMLAQQRNQARRQETQSFIIGGAGLIALGIGWFGYDTVRRKKKT
jgi:hypothetical protein